MVGRQTRKATPAVSSPEDISKQENVSSRSKAAKHANKQQIRHRASVACASCRDRRIRCVVPKGETECSQCKRVGTECIIKNDDERRRPISKAYMASLSDRINMLEGMLMSKGVMPPPPAHPPRTRQEAANQDEADKDKNRAAAEKQEIRIPPSPAQEVPSPPDSTHDFPMQDSDNTDETDSSVLPQAEFASFDFNAMSPDPMLPVLDARPSEDDLVHRLLSTKGNLSFDQLSGRLRFFGPTANSHVYAASANKFDSREPPEQVRRAERIIRSLTITTYEYLMSVFWEYYNDVLIIIDREAFEADRDSQNPKFYSSFLHITMLAAGYRFADKDREDIIKISLGNRESTLHREAKYMLDIELERPGGIPSVQALLLLGDLECGVGRDNTGWMYSGMANRLAFDIGLHLDCTNNGLSDREVSIRHMAMRACVIYDKYWALFLGRPTSIKNQDIGMDLLSRQFSSMLSGSSQTSKPMASRALLVREIYDQLVELMELAGRIVEIRENTRMMKRHRYRESSLYNGAETEDNVYLHVINLDRQLQNWYRRLPEHLTWRPANIKTAPYSFFLLHQQYHVSMILLHRPWAKYGSLADDASTHSHPSPENPIKSPEPTGAAQDHLSPQPAGGAAGGGGSGGGGPSPTTPVGLHHDPNALAVASRTALSRSICTQQAMRVARIFWQHRQRWTSGRQVFVTGIQHAGTAATALIAALAHDTTIAGAPTGASSSSSCAADDMTGADKRSYLGYLEVISHAIHDMSETYHPAERMDALLSAVILQLRQDVAVAQHPFRTRTHSFAALGNTHHPWLSGGGGSGLGGFGGGSLQWPTSSLRSGGAPSSWQGSSSSSFSSSSVLPARRENPDAGAEHHHHGQPLAKRRARAGASTGGTASRRASEFARPPTPFSGFHLGSAARPTPPPGGHGGGGSGSNTLGFELPASISGLFAGLGGDSPFNLDTLQGSAIEMDMADDQHGAGAGKSAEDYIMVSTSKGDSWGGQSVNAIGSAGSHDGGFQMSDWVGPAGLGASSAHHDSAQGDGSNSKDGGKADREGGIEWEEDGLDALSPISLGGLVSSVEKVAGAEVDKSSAPRNHELDFFSF